MPTIKSPNPGSNLVSAAYSPKPGVNGTCNNNFARFRMNKVSSSLSSLSERVYDVMCRMNLPPNHAGALKNADLLRRVDEQITEIEHSLTMYRHARDELAKD